jgi:UDP-GlcNAc:undecaprenyl-phosphate/decaprenyl-phosphate GlcNAc-1-phosphate transferase
VNISDPSMTLIPVLALIFGISVTASLAIARWLSRVPATARPAEKLSRRPTEPIPRLGGVAVCCALPLALVAALYITAFVAGAIPTFPGMIGQLVIACTILFVIGLIDDLRGVPPSAKLVAQTAASLIVFQGGFHLETITFLAGHEFSLGWFSLPLTVLWLVGVSNAFNLIDGLDGLAGGVALIALLCIVPGSMILGHQGTAIYAVALAGALVGFLRYNFPPARIFLGDSGSLVVGFLLAILSVRAATTPAGLTYALLPILALSYLLLDTGIAILRRWLRGDPLSRADSRHIHHQLAALGLSRRRALLVIWSASAALAAFGFSATFAPPEITLILTAGGVSALIVIIGGGIYWLEYHEFFEAGSSIASAMRNARSVIRDKINARDIANAIRVATSREQVENLLLNSAPLFRFSHVSLSDAESRKRAPGRHTQELQALRLWKLEYPIVANGSHDHNGLCLTIWCSLSVTQRPAGAERVAQILGPAITAWAVQSEMKDRPLRIGPVALEVPGNQRADATVSEQPKAGWRAIGHRREPTLDA